MDVMKKAKWVKVRQPVGPGKTVLKLGLYTVGSVFYDGTVHKGEIAVYAAYCVLPGIKEYVGHYEKQEMAEQAVWHAVECWLKSVVEE